ncbi:MAG TPA: helix-turn-helix domain-containing protein [Acidimicrobiales bacterium]|nr:helix-turn-helix domain-containing protein [Acidimicrobiales bacterium]
MLNGEEQARSVVLNRMLVGDLTAAEAAAALGRSVRQVRRMLAAYRKEGAAALAHGNRGCTPTHALDPALRARVVELARTVYAGLNDTHLSEVLGEQEGIALSRASVRRIRLAAGLARPRQRRPPRPSAAAGAQGPGRDAAPARRQQPRLVGGARTAAGLGGGHRRRHRDGPGGGVPRA